jgi:ubiquinone/menaquinone biosynthesis C-methylase UbiE
MDEVNKTKDVYGFLWGKESRIKLPETYHFDRMQEVIPEKIVRGLWGIDVGSGCGYDTYIMAKNNPNVKIISIDISNGVYTNSKINRSLPNVQIIKGSVLETPFKDSVFDFAYSFGVLHHTPDPQKALSEIFRLLKKKSPTFLYLYEDHSENIIKYLAIKFITLLRRITIKIPSNALYILSFVASPFVYLLFSISAKFLMKIEFTKWIADKLPFNFGTSFFSLQGDLYDRFGAPIEYRFGRKEVYNMFDKHGFFNITITRLKATSGWVVWGYKK